MSENNHTSWSCPRRFELIRLAVGDLSSQHLEDVRSHTLACQKCAQELARIEQQKQSFLSHHPWEKNSELLFMRVNTARISRRRPAWFFPAIATVFAVGGVLCFLLFFKPEPSTIRTKGDVSLSFFVQRGTHIVPGVSGGEYQANDQIQCVYSSGPNHYLFLVSLDEKGRISNFNYQGKAQSIAIIPGNNQVLEGSIILDESNGLERVFAIFSDQPLEFSFIEQAGKQAFSQMMSR